MPSGGSPQGWATVTQVHGNAVRVVEASGNYGEADALVTQCVDVPLAIFTADCLGVVLMGTRTIGVAHCGWRGLERGVLDATISAMAQLGDRPTRAAAGPGIGPCCFEVGEEVLAAFAGDTASTTWGSPSVDLFAVVQRQLDSIELMSDRSCTQCGDDFYSYRNGDVSERMATVGWIA